MKRKRFDPFILFFLFVALLISFFLLSPPKSKPDKKSRLPTTYSTHQAGMKGVYLILKKLRKDTRRWKRPLPLLVNEEIGTLLVTNPRKPLSPREKEALENWFSKGGQMFLMHDEDWEIKATGYHQKVQSFKECFEGHPQLFILKDAEKLTNKRLSLNPKDATPLLLQLLSHKGPLYFDEYHLNCRETASPFQLMNKTFHHPIGWVIMHLIIVFFLYLLSRLNLKETKEGTLKSRMNLLSARAAFLERSQSKEFADQVITKWRRYKINAY